MTIPNIEILTHQYDLMQDITTRFICLIGGYRSGKTFSLCLKAIQLANANELPGIICEPVYSMIGRVLIPTMNELLLKLNIKYDLNKSDGKYILYLAGQEKVIWLLSSENYQRAAGISASYFLMDEADLMKKEIGINAFNMLVSRLTRGYQMQGILVSTPEGFNTCYELFVEKEGSDRRLIRASTYDNPFIDDSYIENMKQTHSGAQIEAYLNGYFVNLTSGSVYYNFDRTIHHSNREITSTDYNILVGQDFNVNNNTSIICISDGNKIFAVDEITGARNTEHTIQLLQERYGDRQIIIFPDSSGNNSHSSTSWSDIALFKKAGFIVKCHNKNPFVKNRVASVNAALKNAKNEVRFYVNTNKCKLLTKSLEQQGYDPKTGAPDKSSGLDHCVDALGYLIYFIFPVTEKSTAKQLF